MHQATHHVTIKNDIDFSPDTLLHLSFSTHLKLTTACQIPNQNRGWEEVKRSESCSLHLCPLRFMNKARTIKSYHSLPRKKGTFWPFPQNETLEISFGPSSSPILLLLKLDNIWRWQKNKKCRAATIRPPHLLLTEEAAVGLHLLLHAVVVDVVLLHVIYVSVRPSNLLFRRRHIYSTTMLQLVRVWTLFQTYWWRLKARRDNGQQADSTRDLRKCSTIKSAIPKTSYLVTNYAAISEGMNTLPDIGED